MRFKEEVLTTQNFITVNEGIKAEKQSVPPEYNPFWIVNLMPSHPYQYPLHYQIKNLLNTASLNRLREVHRVKDIVFLVGPSVVSFYESTIRELNCRFTTSVPQYPFMIRNISVFPSREVQHFHWFDFLALLLEGIGQRVIEIPLSLTIIHEEKDGNKIIRTNIKPGTSVSEIITEAGLSENAFVFTNHPFIGEVLSGDSEFSRIEPLEILALPIDMDKSYNIFQKLTFKFMRTSRSFSGWCRDPVFMKNRPCQRCLACSSICPEGLHPFMLSAIAQKGNLKDAVELNLIDCVECGLCSYACPSDIPLMSHITSLKKEL